MVRIEAMQRMGRLQNGGFMNIEKIKQEMQTMVDDGYLLSYYFFNHASKGLVFVGVSEQGESIYFEQYPPETIYCD